MAPKMQEIGALSRISFQVPLLNIFSYVSHANTFFRCILAYSNIEWIQIRYKSIPSICIKMWFIWIIQLDFEMDSVVVVLVVVQSCYAVFDVFIVCDIGERASGAFSEISDIIYQFHWYLLPAEIQQMLPSIIYFAQQPVDFVCFGSITCSRESFKKVSTIIEKSSDRLNCECWLLKHWLI